MVYLDRYSTGDIRQEKSCTPPGEGVKFLCNDPSRDHEVSCCYYNMCNADIHLTFPPSLPTTWTLNDVRGKVLGISLSLQKVGFF